MAETEHEQALNRLTEAKQKLIEIMVAHGINKEEAASEVDYVILATRKVAEIGLY